MSRAWGTIFTARRAATLAALGAVLAAAAAAPAAHANPRGRILGLVPRVVDSGGAPTAAAAQTRASGGPLIYHGGPVVHKNTTHVIWWAPSGFSYPAHYKAQVGDFLSNVAAASGRTDNVYSVVTQYYDTEGLVRYEVKHAGGIRDTTPYPLGCVPGVGYSACVSDAQIAAEVNNVINSHGLRRGMHDIYFVLFPPDVDSCLNGMCASNFFCAYHSWSGIGDSNTVLYADIPYGDVAGCQSGQSPNGNPADQTINNLSHEHREVMNDPTGQAWYDSSGAEGSDKCRNKYGRTGSTSFGDYNQVIAGGYYYLQREWSNIDNRCTRHL